MAKGLIRVRQKISQLLFEEDMKNYLKTIIEYWNIPSLDALGVIYRDKTQIPGVRGDRKISVDSFISEIGDPDLKNIIEDLGVYPDVVRVSGYLYNQFGILGFNSYLDGENRLDDIPGTTEIKDRMIKSYHTIYRSLMIKVERFINACDEELGTIRTYLPEMADIIMVKKTGRTQAGRFLGDTDLIRTRGENLAAIRWIENNSPVALKLAELKKEIEDTIVSENLGISDAVGEDIQAELEKSGWKREEITFTARTSVTEGHMTIVSDEDHDFNDNRRYFVNYKEEWKIDQLPDSLKKLLISYIKTWHKNKRPPIGLQENPLSITGLYGETYEGVKKEIQVIRDDMKKRAEEIKPWIQKN